MPFIWNFHLTKFQRAVLFKPTMNWTLFSEQISWSKYNEYHQSGLVDIENCTLENEIPTRFTKESDIDQIIINLVTRDNSTAVLIRLMHPELPHKTFEN